MNAPPLRRALITGASGAVGAATCAALVARGHRVVGTLRARRGRGAAVADRLTAIGVTVVEMDVTDQASVDAGVAAALDALGGLDVVLNNAGIGSYGVQELFSAEEMHQVFDVNVYGVQRVMRAVLPQLRAQGAGTVAYTSSLIGRVSVPLYATYCASKWALEAMAQAYRAELARFGIDSFIVEPGALPTAFLDDMLRPEAEDEAYAPEAAAAEAALEAMVAMLRANPGQRPELVAQVVAELLDRPHGARPFRVIADQTGMGELIAGYNELLGQVTRALYSANGMSPDLLRLNVGPT